MLRQLELVGFKSFADRTQFGFPAGITCVVGPNGSGKSNVVDAVKWVLGEQSVRSLRGKESTDVIFNGSGSRKPMNLAEVTLTFDNSGGLFASMPMAEVAITRRLYRSGDSEYLINGQVVRLRDLRALLSGTGLGTQAYCVIEQGKVDALLSASPKDRRLLFEEAAGISRFRVRKLEAIRRLERVDQNLLRISDMVEQVRDRLESVRHQAGKARRYRDLSQRWETLRIGAAWFDQRQLGATLESQIRDLTAVQEARDTLVAESESSELTLAQIDAAIRDVAGRVREAEAAAAGDRERTAGLETFIEREHVRLAEIAAQIDRFHRQRLELSVREQELSGQERRLEAECHAVLARRAAALSQLAEQESRVGTLGVEIAASTESLNVQRDELVRRTQMAGKLDNRISSLEGKVESADAACAQIEQQRSEFDAQRELLAVQRTQLEAENERLQWTAAAKNADWSAVLTAIDTLREERRAHEVVRDTERQKRTAVAERIAVLEELEKRHEGLSPGVREVLQLADSAASAPIDSSCPTGLPNFGESAYFADRNGVSGSNPFTQVRGLVADLFRVSVEEASLIETALGDRSQYVVASPEPELLDELVRDPFRFAGRVGFLWLNPADGDGTTVDTAVDLTGRRGVMVRADRLIDTDAEYRPLARRLLATTWIVETLRDALSLAQVAPGVRFITCTGEVYDSDGAVTLGPRHVASGLISRRSELRQLRASRILISERLDAMESQLAAVDRRIGVEEERGRQLAGIHRDAVDELSRHSHEITAAAERQRQFERRQREFLRELQRVQQKRDEAIATLEEQRWQRREMETELERFEDEVARLAGELETLGLRHEQLAGVTTDARIETAKAEEAERNIDSRLVQLAESRRDHRIAVATCVEQLDLNRIRATESVMAILHAESELATNCASRESTAAAISSLIADHDAALGQRAELAGNVHKYRSRIRRLDEKVRQHEVAVEQTRVNLASLRERFREDFDRDLAEITEDEFLRITASGDDECGTDEGGSDKNDDAAADSESGVGSGKIDAAAEVVSVRSVLTETLVQQIATKREAMQREIESLRWQLQSLGSVNQEALAELDALETRHTGLDGEYRDLVTAKSHLEKILERIDEDSRRIFLTTVETIRGHFQKLYRDLFGGGRADIVLDQEADPLESGIEIVARPPGKQLQSLMLLSGGEKTMTCVALLLALFRSHPGPFCILDEVDAALDESNVGLFADVLREFQTQTQFIMISHSKRSMASATTLHGVTMQEPGVSRRISVRFEDVTEEGNIRAA